ncbi:MAG: glycosyltransferase [Nitrospirae bacterium]|nr:glycosyltransferase [Nitrospirota bacterium]
MEQVLDDGCDDPISHGAMANQSRLKILHVVLSLDYGGTEKIVVDLVNGLPRLEFDSSVLCMDRGGRRVSQVRRDVPVHIMGRRPGLSLSNFQSFYSFLARIKPDIVHFRNFTTYFWGCLPSKVFRNIRVIYSDHSEIVFHCQAKKKGKLIARRLLKRLTDGFMTNCEIFKEKLVDCLRMPPSEILVIANGIDANRFFPLSEMDRQSARLENGFTEGDCILGIVASFRAKKNIALAIHAMVDLATRLPQAKLVLVGEGEQESELRHLVDQLGMGEKVVFAEVRKDVNTIVNAFDVFLFPSAYGEGMPNAVLEAMAAKIPIVASDIPGNVEIMEGEERGALFANNQKDSMVQAVMNAVSDPGQARRRAEKAYLYIQEERSLSKMIDQYSRFYHAVFEGRNGGSGM